MTEREDWQKKEFRKAHEHLSRGLDEAVRDFVEDEEVGRFDRLLDNTQEALVKAGEISTLDPVFAALIISDTLARDSKDGNRQIILAAKDMDVEPLKNFIGERLQANSCLSQLLKRRDQ